MTESNVGCRTANQLFQIYITKYTLIQNTIKTINTDRIIIKNGDFFMKRI